MSLQEFNAWKKRTANTETLSLKGKRKAKLTIIKLNSLVQRSRLQTGEHLNRPSIIERPIQKLVVLIAPTWKLNVPWHPDTYCSSILEVSSRLLTELEFATNILSHTHNLQTNHLHQRCPRGVMVKAINCGIVVREFVLQSRYYVHFRANTLGKGMNPLILPPAMGK